MKKIVATISVLHWKHEGYNHVSKVFNGSDTLASVEEWAIKANETSTLESVKFSKFLDEDEEEITPPQGEPFID